MAHQVGYHELYDTLVETGFGSCRKHDFICDLVGFDAVKGIVHPKLP